MQRYIAIIILFIATATSSMADTNGELIQRIDSIIDNITQIYGKKQARIDFYKSMAHKSQKPETLLSAYDKLYDEYFEKPNSHKAHELLHTTYTKRPLYE